MLFARMLEQNASSNLHQIGGTTRSIENRTKHHNISNPTIIKAQDNYATLSAKMSGCVSDLAFVNREVRAKKSILTTMDAYQNQQDPLPAAGDLAVVSAEVDEYVRAFEHHIHRLEDEIAYWSRLSEVQLQQ